MDVATVVSGVGRHCFQRRGVCRRAFYRCGITKAIEGVHRRGSGGIRSVSGFIWSIRVFLRPTTISACSVLSQMPPQPPLLLLHPPPPLSSIPTLLFFFSILLPLPCSSAYPPKH